MITKPSNIGRWIGAIIATVVIIGASFLTFHAFYTKVSADAENSPQSVQSGTPQSVDIQSGDLQSGDMPRPVPTPAEITKPTPPKGLQEGGQVGAQTTALWFVELWEYAFNTGDTEEFNQICQDGDFCDRFAEEVKSLREDSVVIQPLEYTIIPDSTRSHDCYKRGSGILGVCVELSISEKSAIVQGADTDDTSREYTTVHTEKSDGTQKENKFSLHLFITEQDDHSCVVSGFLLRRMENA